MVVAAAGYSHSDSRRIYMELVAALVSAGIREEGNFIFKQLIFVKGMTELPLYPRLVIVRARDGVFSCTFVL